MHTAKCQTFIKLLHSFHARAELLCSCNEKLRENDSDVNVGGDEGALLIKHCHSVRLLPLVCIWKGAARPHRFIIWGLAEWRSHTTWPLHWPAECVCASNASFSRYVNVNNWDRTKLSSGKINCTVPWFSRYSILKRFPWCETVDTQVKIDARHQQVLHFLFWIQQPSCFETRPDLFFYCWFKWST